MAMISAETVKNLRASVILAVLMIAVGAGCVVASNTFLAGEQRSLKATQAKVADLKNRLSKARDEELEIKQKIARFTELEARGILGEEERLNWVEQIRRIKTERKLYEIQYEISPQHPISQTMLPGTSGSFEFYASPMQLRMDLLHEEDLLNFLSDLGRAIHAHIRVDKCSVERQHKTEADARTGPQLRAECALHLITARERKSS